MEIQEERDFVQLDSKMLLYAYGSNEAADSQGVLESLGTAKNKTV